jgi:hypothetical protein
VPSFESYDLAHLEFILRAANRIRRAHPTLAPLGYDGGAGGYVVTLVVQAGSRCPIHPQLSTGFPVSPGYPHLVDSLAPDRYL